MSSSELVATDPQMDKPFVTVVMPVRNEAEYITRALSSVLDQDYPSDRYEIVISDGMSTDATRERATDISRNRSVRIVDNPARITPTALNTAIHASTGEIVVRVDGHCEVPRDYVSRCVSLLQEHACSGVGGPIETIGDSTVAEAIAAAMSSRFGVGGSSFRTTQDQALWADTVPFPAYRRRVFEEVGLYDEELIRNQDDEFNARIRKANGRLLLSPLLRSRYYSRGSIRSLWRQYYQYGYWKVRVLQKHPRQMAMRHFAPAGFLVMLAALGAASLVSEAARYALLAGILTYGLACVAAAIGTAYKKGWCKAPLLPLVFATLHISYGLGSLVGLWRFRNRWGDQHGNTPQLDSARPRREESVRIVGDAATPQQP